MVTEAYQVLGDPKAKELYDEKSKVKKGIQTNKATEKEYFYFFARTRLAKNNVGQEVLEDETQIVICKVYRYRIPPKPRPPSLRIVNKVGKGYKFGKTAQLALNWNRGEYIIRHHLFVAEGSKKNFYLFLFYFILFVIYLFIFF